ncbi:MAG TPA: hypothetical protein VGG78_07155 [Gemmatimonadaceae bacterium]
MPPVVDVGHRFASAFGKESTATTRAIDEKPGWSPLALSSRASAAAKPHGIYKLKFIYRPRFIDYARNSMSLSE